MHFLGKKSVDELKLKKKLKGTKEMTKFTLFRHQFTVRMEK